MFWADKEDAVELYYKFRWATSHEMEDWLDRLAMLGVIEEEDYHRELGKIFDIPECCREWFIYLSCKCQVKNPLISTDNICGNDLSRCGYVRCPYCRTNGRGDNGKI